MRASIDGLLCRTKQEKLDLWDKWVESAMKWENGLVMEAEDYERKEKTKALKEQVGGTHYKSMPIQPIEFIMANDLPFIEGNIIKYVCRWKQKGGKEDLEKVIHYATILLEQQKT